jgi:hypothetical protein
MIVLYNNDHNHRYVGDIANRFNYDVMITHLETRNRFLCEDVLENVNAMVVVLDSGIDDTTYDKFFAIACRAIDMGKRLFIYDQHTNNWSLYDPVFGTMNYEYGFVPDHESLQEIRIYMKQGCVTFAITELNNNAKIAMYKLFAPISPDHSCFAEHSIELGGCK